VGFRRIRLAIIAMALATVVYFVLSICGAIAMMEIPRIRLGDPPDSFSYKDVSFTSRGDGVVLNGWYIPGNGSYAIIIVHGGFQNRVDYNVDTLGLATDLLNEGYDILLFDLRGRGQSEGKGLYLSNIERDIGGAVDYLKNRGYSAEDIGIIGFCSGAASALIFASQENIGALVLDGVFDSVENLITTEMSHRGIPKFAFDLLFPGILLMAETIYHYELINPIDVVATIDCPILFIHEEQDESISLEETQRLMAASAKPRNELWQVSQAEHSHGYRTHPSIYIEKVSTFFATTEARR